MFSLINKAAALLSSVHQAANLVDPAALGRS